MSTATRPRRPPTTCSCGPPPEGPTIVAAGRYHDRLVRDGRGWRFRERAITMLGAAEGDERWLTPGSGPTAAPRPTAAGPGPCPMPWTGSEFVPVERYFDPEFADLERTDCGPTPGRWPAGSRRSRRPATTSSTRSAISRSCWCGSTTETVRGYLNACRHRATELAKGTGTFGDGRIICPFHGWRWDLDGKNTFVYGAHAFDPAAADAGRALPPPGPGGDLGRVRVGQPGPRQRRRCSRRSTPSPACSTRWVWPTCGCLVEGGHPAGQLEDGPGGVHGGLPRPPDPPPAHPRPSRAVRPRQPGLLGVRRWALELPTATQRPGQEGAAGRRQRNRRHHRVGPSAEQRARGDDPSPRGAGHRRDAPPDDPRRQHLRGRVGQGCLRVRRRRGHPPATARSRRPWPGGAACSSCSPTTSSSPSTATPSSTGCGPTATTPSRASSSCGRSPSRPGATRSPDRCAEGPYAPDDTEHWPRIPLQDFSNIGRQQRGIHSQSFEGLRLSRTYEGGITQMHRQLDRYLASSWGA